MPPDQSPDIAGDRFRVHRSGPLHGAVRVGGAKNSALKLMAAALLAEGETTIGNVPAIADIPIMAEVLRGLGAEVEVDVASVTIRVDEPHGDAPAEHVARIRASVSILGPLVGRVGRARLALPGGDRIGARKIDLHLRGLVAMGADVIERPDAVEVQASRLHGVDVTLDFPSVGATENLVMAATLAQGRTTIENAAREPEVADLCHMLVAMGAAIDGIGSATLVVEGVEALRPVAYTTIPDRIEAGTLAIAAALTGGDVSISGLRPSDLHLPLVKLRAVGAVVEETKDAVAVKGGALRACDFVTLPYPGFPTDLQSQMIVLLSQAEGTSMCTENVFESRFAFVEELRRLGADVEIDGHHGIIRGPRRLRGTAIRALDVRAGAAAVLAGLIADGETIVTEVHHVDRGYADLPGQLRALGADIERVAGFDA